MRKVMIAAAFALTAFGAVGEDNVVSYRIVNADTIPASLTGASGDAARGETLYADPEAGNCASCHGLPGEGVSATAPRLDDVAARLPEGRIRLWIVEPEVLSPGTDMPAFYRVGQRTDPEDPRYGEPRLSAGEIEDIVAYLLQAGG